METDASELRDFAADVGRIGPKMQKKTKSIVSKGALNIKNTMREDFSHSAHFKQVGKTISYEVNETADGVEAEIGPNKHYRSARIANIAYFGGIRGGGGTVDVENGLRQEVPNFVEHMRSVVGDAF